MQLPLWEAFVWLSVSLLKLLSSDVDGSFPNQRKIRDLLERELSCEFRRVVRAENQSVPFPVNLANPCLSYNYSFQSSGDGNQNWKTG